MALTRKMLKAMGIEEEKIDQIIDAHTETVDGIKADRDHLKESADKLATVQKELDEMKAAAEKDGKDPFKVKYEAIKEEFDAYKADIIAKETTAKTSAAFKELLKAAGISEKRIDAVTKVTDLSAMKLTADGKLENESELMKSIKTEWADFIVTEGTAGAKVPNPPSTEPVDYDSMSDAEYYKATYEANKNKGD